MSENDENFWSMISKTQGDCLKCLVVSLTQRYSVYRHNEVKKQENIHIWEAGIRDLWHFSSKKERQTIDDQNR